MRGRDFGAILMQLSLDLELEEDVDFILEYFKIIVNFPIYDRSESVILH